MKRPLRLFSSTLLVLTLLCSCGPCNEPLPTDVHNVGVDPPIHTKDVLPSANVIPTGQPLYGDPSETPTPTDDVETAARVDMVQSLMSDVVDGTFTEEDSGFAVKMIATGKYGGQIAVVTMSGVYRGVEFSYPLDDGSNDNTATYTAFQNYLCAYLGRNMTATEKEALETYIANVAQNDSLEYAAEFMPFAEVYLYLEDGNIIVQAL